MIIWITGNSKAGKTTTAKLFKSLANDKVVILDGDDMRFVWQDLGFSKEDRYIQNLRIAKLAKILEKQGFIVVVASICPYKRLRDSIQDMIDCKFIYLSGGKAPSGEYPYEERGYID